MRSLPTPLSPVTSTLPSDTAARSAADTSACIDALATINVGPERNSLDPGPACESVDMGDSRPRPTLSESRKLAARPNHIHDGSAIINPSNDCTSQPATTSAVDQVTAQADNYRFHLGELN